jgi:RNA polymerase sigma-70 factor (ECF subfamily)
LRATYEIEFLAAFQASVADLLQRDRRLLRFVFVEEMTPAQVGAMYGCHRTTAIRWIETARDEVLQRTRSRLMERLEGNPPTRDVAQRG